MGTDMYLIEHPMWDRVTLWIRMSELMMKNSTRRHWGHIVTFLRFADHFRLSKQDWNVLYSEIVYHRNTVVPPLLPLIVMYLYFYVRS